jgi:dUTPase
MRYSCDLQTEGFIDNVFAQQPVISINYLQKTQDVQNFETKNLQVFNKSIQLPSAEEYYSDYIEFRENLIQRIKNNVTEHYDISVSNYLNSDDIERLKNKIIEIYYEITKFASDEVSVICNYKFLVLENNLPFSNKIKFYCSNEIGNDILIYPKYTKQHNYAGLVYIYCDFKSMFDMTDWDLRCSRGDVYSIGQSLKVAKMNVEYKNRGFEVVRSDCRKFNKQIQLPQRGSKDSAGYDFFSNETIELQPFESHIFWTDIKSYMLKGEVLQIYVRSSIGIKKGLMLKNTVGIVDCVPAGTLIKTKDGDIKVEELMNENKILLSYNENKEIIEEDSLKEIFIVEYDELIHIETEEGDIVEIPENKEVYTKRGWIRAKDLNINDTILKY